MLEYSEADAVFTEDVKARARRYGFDLVGFVSAEEYDALPAHWIGHRDYLCYSGKTGNYLEGARSLIVVGIRVWDSLFDMVVKVGDHHEYPDEWRGRYYARRLIRYLNGQGYKTVLEPDLLSKKQMARLSGLGAYGKQSLIINPVFGPWIRLRSILTDAVLVPSEPFTGDLCGDCTACVDACPVGALEPYRVDPDRCLLGMSWETRLSPEMSEVYYEHCPWTTENTWMMCNTCQKACPIGRELRDEKMGRAV